LILPFSLERDIFRIFWIRNKWVVVVVAMIKLIIITIIIIIIIVTLFSVDTSKNTHYSEQRHD